MVFRRVQIELSLPLAPAVIGQTVRGVREELNRLLLTCGLLFAPSRLFF